MKILCCNWASKVEKMQKKKRLDFNFNQNLLNQIIQNWLGFRSDFCQNKKELNVFIAIDSTTIL